MPGQRIVNPTKQQIAALRAENARWPRRLKAVDRMSWGPQMRSDCVGVWRSRDYLVQARPSGHAGILILSINRTDWQIQKDSWGDEIPWDDLQRLKREAGYGDYDAVEVYPRDIDIVNVTNMRHLFVFADGSLLQFAWRRIGPPDEQKSGASTNPENPSVSA